MPQTQAIQIQTIQLVIPFHQPIHREVEALEAWCTRYFPLLEVIAAQPAARVAIHLSGRVLDHIAQRHESWLLRLKDLSNAGQIEVLGGFFYGGVAAHMRQRDVFSQVIMMTEFLGVIVLASGPQGFGYRLCDGPSSSHD
ncbi:MAG: hypothetical protein R3C68_11325 [Myxococcota bacterium]